MKRHCLLPLSIVIGLFATPAHAEAWLPAIGGSGGGQFKANCNAGELLTGFELRTGDDVDAIRPVCATVSGPSQIGPRPLTTDSGLVPIGPQNGLFGGLQQVASGWYGGPGGRIERLLCPDSTPIVIGMDVAAEGADTVVVNNIHLYCGQAVASQTPAAYPSAIFDAPGYRPSPGAFGFTGKHARLSSGPQRCPDGQVAIGTHGRSGKWLDAMGLICGEPPAFHPAKALGRVTSSSPSGPPRPICDVARQARARNSPAAPGLEAQCRAAGSAAPVKVQGSAEIVGPGRYGTWSVERAGQSAERSVLRPDDYVVLNPQPLPPEPPEPQALSAADAAGDRATQAGIIIVSGKTPTLRSKAAQAQLEAVNKVGEDTPQP